MYVFFFTVVCAIFFPVAFAFVITLLFVLLSLFSHFSCFFFLSKNEEKKTDIKSALLLLLLQSFDLWAWRSLAFSYVIIVAYRLKKRKNISFFLEHIIRYVCVYIFFSLRAIRNTFNNSQKKTINLQGNKSHLAVKSKKERLWSSEFTETETQLVFFSPGIVCV